MDDLAGWRAVTPPLPSAVFWRGKRVFLTGHTGFKGGWLALWLHELGAEVAGYALPPPTSPLTSSSVIFPLMAITFVS